MSKIKILYFAAVKEQLGIGSENLEFAEPLSVLELKKILAARLGNWEMFKQDDILQAINHEMVKTDANLKDGDELAFFPQVTGG